MNWTEAMDIAERGFKRWAEKEHNTKWVRKIDGTPIKNDLLVNIATEIAEAQPTPSDTGPEVGDDPSDYVNGRYCKHCGLQGGHARTCVKFIEDKPTPSVMPDCGGGETNNGGRAVIEGRAVVIRFPFDAMQGVLDGAWGMKVFDQRQKITDIEEFAKEFQNELNAESEDGTTLIHRMADKAFLNMMEQGAFGFE